MQCYYAVYWPRQTSLLWETVFVHYRRFGRHPSTRGHSESDHIDSSDEEWDDYISRYFGPDYGGVHGEVLHPMDEDIPIHRVVEDAFGLIEEIYVHARENDKDVEDREFDDVRGQYAEMAVGDNVDFMSTDGSPKDLNHKG
jgi:hypothetical protein